MMYLLFGAVVIGFAIVFDGLHGAHKGLSTISALLENILRGTANMSEISVKELREIHATLESIAKSVGRIDGSRDVLIELGAIRDRLDQIQNAIERSG